MVGEDSGLDPALAQSWDMQDAANTSKEIFIFRIKSAELNPSLSHYCTPVYIFVGHAAQGFFPSLCGREGPSAKNLS